MPKKKLEVVELNKKEDQIVLEEGQSAFVLFWHRYGKAICLVLLLLSLIIASISIFLIFKNLRKSEEMVIREVSIETTLDSLDFVNANHSFDDADARMQFDKDSIFKSKGEVLLIKTTEHSKFYINFYSDGTAVKIMKDGSSVTRISSVDGGYGIGNDGIIKSKAVKSELTITTTKEYPWGKVVFLSDGSAYVENSKMDVFVRDGKDVEKNYISTNKVTYLKDTKNVGGTQLYYYHDGTIEVVKNGKSYVVRTSDDLNITGADVTFNNNNVATIYQTKKTSDGYTIDYYTDGGAIIRNGSKTLSVRKSNSIVIKDNKIYEIVDNKYVTVSNTKDNVTYYTNGSAVVTSYNGGDTLYIPENSDIKYDTSNGITSVGNKFETLTKETNIAGERIQVFEETAVIKTDDYIAIVPKDGILYDTEGKIKQIEPPKSDDGKKTFTISNNTNEDLNYVVVIEKSPRTNLDVSYVRYQLETNSKYIEPSQLKVWNDKASQSLNVEGTNYILIKDTIAAQSAEDIGLMLWTDYTNIPNSQMHKYFYGTIKVYAWTEEKKDT